MNKIYRYNQLTKKQVYHFDHVKLRIKQRYSINYNLKTRNEILNLLNSSTMLFKLTNTRTLYLIEYKNKDIYVLWNRKDQDISTVMTKEMVRTQTKILLNAQFKAIRKKVNDYNMINPWNNRVTDLFEYI